jgi:Na+/phosphate symporter
VRSWRTPLGRAVLLGIALGTAGALLGLAVGASRDASLASGAAWGLYIAGALLLFLGASPSLAPPLPDALVTAMPDGAREQMMQRQRARIVDAPWMLLNFLVAVTLIGIGALIEIYG